MKWAQCYLQRFQLVTSKSCKFSVSFGVINDHNAPPTDNKIQPVWNSHLSEPKRKNSRQSFNTNWLNAPLYV